MDHRVDVLKDRTKQFALRIIRVIRSLPVGSEGKNHRESALAFGNVSGRKLPRGVSGTFAAGMLSQTSNCDRRGRRISVLAGIVG